MEKLLLIEFDPNAYDIKHIVEYLGQQLHIDSTNSIFIKELDFNTTNHICNDPKIFIR